MDSDADYNLVEESQERSFDCPVCLQIICDPRTSLCCKKEFCRACIAKIRKSGDQCPLCRCARFKTRKNTTLSHELYHLQVYCGNRSKGCGWIGCLGEAEVHLNQRPAERYQSNGCLYVDIQCTYCGESFNRGEIQGHSERCPKRPFNCEHCQSYDSTYDDVTTNHWPVCGLFPVLCPNNCDQYIRRQIMDEHISTNCPMTMVECDFKQFGCKERLTRGEMLIHMKYSVAAHEALQRVMNVVKLLKNHEKDISQLESKLHEKYNNVMREQSVVIDRNVARATSKVLGSLEQKTDEKYNNLMREQSVLFDRNVARATSKVLGSLEQKTKQLEDLGRQFDKKITRDGNATRRMESLCQRCENVLGSRREYEARIRDYQGALIHILHHRVLDLEANSVCRRLLRKGRELLNTEVCRLIIFLVVIATVVLVASLRRWYIGFY